MEEWRHILGRSDLSREEFQQACVAIIRHFYPESRVEPGPNWGELKFTPREGEPMTIFLGNLWSNLKGLPEGRAAEAERFLRIIAAPDFTSEQLPNPKDIVPTLKDAEYLEITRHQDGTLKFAHEHFAGDLWIVYAIDGPESIRSLMLTQMAKLNLTLGSLRTLAIDNLRRILSPIEQVGDGPVFMLTAGGDYVASLLLFEDLWNELQAESDGDIVAAAPSRDVLLFTRSTSNEGIATLRETIERIMLNGGYLVSTGMLRWGPAGWSVFS